MTRDLNARTGADFEESPQVKIKRLERTLGDERRFAERTTRQLHRVLVRDLRAAEQRATAAEQALQKAETRARKSAKAAAAAQRRTRHLGAELESVRQSTTWKAGRAVLAVPVRVRRWRRS